MLIQALIIYLVCELNKIQDLGALIALIALIIVPFLRKEANEILASWEMFTSRDDLLGLAFSRTADEFCPLLAMMEG